MEWILAVGLFALFLTIYLENKAPSSQEVVNRPERRKICLPMIIEAPYEFPFSVLTYDLSLGGCFISLNDMKHSMIKPALLGKGVGLKMGQDLKIHLQTGRFSSIALEGEVVRYEFETQGQYPAGVGIQFKNVSKKTSRKLGLILFEREKESIKKAT